MGKTDGDRETDREQTTSEGDTQGPALLGVQGCPAHSVLLQRQEWPPQMHGSPSSLA